jgi:Flp pilus assembly protein TadD
MLAFDGGQMKTFRLLGCVAVIALGLAGCGGVGDNGAIQAYPAGYITETSTFGSGPEQAWIDKAKANFRNGEYGLAERYFRQAVEERGQNVEAWLGLAASYDHLKRFDEAWRAYEVVRKITGPTPTYLNNLGYHYMLKGEFGSAEQTLLTAQAKDPSNLFIQANLVLLADWKVAAGRPG